jgi:NAD(P)-dependent dehydrogenase (short-subunit alcohol dehydrogenase family)
LAAGENVVATARNPDQLQDLVKRYPSSARAVRLDVTDRAQAAAAVEATTDAFGRLDVLVNNAGYANVDSIEDFAEDDFRAQIETNLWGVINLTRAAVPVLREQSSGHILQISSVGGRDTTPGLGPHQTAKWAVEGFSGVLQKELAPLGIHVTLIEPGGVRTDWAGASMHVADIRSVYRPTVGLIAEYAASGTPRSDPFKTAQAILQITQVDDPPLRLLLGSDAFTIARAADEAKISSDERWKNLTLSTDADGVSREDQAGAHIPADAPAVTPTPTNAPLIFVATNRLKPGSILWRAGDRQSGLEPLVARPKLSFLQVLWVFGTRGFFTRTDGGFRGGEAAPENLVRSASPVGSAGRTGVRLTVPRPWWTVYCYQAASWRPGAGCSLVSALRTAPFACIAAIWLAS